MYTLFGKFCHIIIVICEIKNLLREAKHINIQLFEWLRSVKKPGPNKNPLLLPFKYVTVLYVCYCPYKYVSLSMFSVHYTYVQIRRGRTLFGVKNACIQSELLIKPGWDQISPGLSVPGDWTPRDVTSLPLPPPLPNPHIWTDQGEKTWLLCLYFLPFCIFV